MAGIDFNNQKGSNLGEAKFEKDAVNLMLARRLVSNGISALYSGFTGTTILGTGVTTTLLSATTASFDTMQANSSIVTSANTISASTTYLTANTATIATISASTINMQILQFQPITYSPTPTKGLMYFSGISNKLYVFTGNTLADLVDLTD